MTRKDFQLIADVLKRHAVISDNMTKTNVIKAIALDFAVQLKDTNPRFNIQRFIKACEGTNV